MHFTGIIDFLHGSLKIRVIELARNTHRSAEIEISDPQAIDAFDDGDIICIRLAIRRFDLGEDSATLVGVAQFLQHRPRLVAIMRHLKRDAVMSLRRIFGVRDDLHRFLTGTHH